MRFVSDGTTLQYFCFSTRALVLHAGLKDMKAFVNSLRNYIVKMLPISIVAQLIDLRLMQFYSVTY